jgi:hypothetical protein
MLIDLELKEYSRYFPSAPHPFISEPFIELNKSKTQKIVRLVEDTQKPPLGLIAGLKNDVLHSPFSAPFGGFHFRKEIMYISEIDRYINSLKEYIISEGIKGVEITLPPDIYHTTFNAKTVSSLIRNGFSQELPGITNWVNLQQFEGEFKQRNSREYYRQAVRNNLSFSITTDIEDKKVIYELIHNNRAKFGRPIYMTLEDILDTGKLWPVDFFKVTGDGDTLMASAIFYRSHPDICHAVFWGDNDTGRPLRAMDYLIFNLWTYYKESGYKYIDLGVSTESGQPNEGLLRFKESHEATSALKYTFAWKADMNH